MSLPHTDVMPASGPGRTVVPPLDDDLRLPARELPESASAPDLVHRRVRDELMLDGLALKRRRQQRRRAQGRATARPNLVMGANVQVCWKKFANYFATPSAGRPSLVAG